MRPTSNACGGYWTATFDSSDPTSKNSPAVRSAAVGEALLGEVSVEGERLAKSLTPHDLEADAIHEAQPPATCGQQCRDTGLVKLRVYPDDVQHGDHVVSQGPNRTEPALRQRERLHKNVARGRERRLAGEQLAPQVVLPSSGPRMALQLVPSSFHRCVGDGR